VNGKPASLLPEFLALPTSLTEDIMNKLVATLIAVSFASSAFAQAAMPATPAPAKSAVTTIAPAVVTATKAGDVQVAKAVTKHKAKSTHRKSKTNAPKTAVATAATDTAKVATSTAKPTVSTGLTAAPTLK
jgi:nucleoside phosphorylase